MLKNFERQLPAKKAWSRQTGQNNLRLPQSLKKSDQGHFSPKNLTSLAQ